MRGLPKLIGLQMIFLAVVAMTFLSIIVIYAQKSTDSLVIKGYRFFNAKDGTSVPIKGIAYYPRPNAGKLNVNNYDFFTSEHQAVWKRDIAQFKALNINAVRIYAVDPSKNHDAFMCALAEAGIYVFVGLAANCEGCAITKDSAPTCYPNSLKLRGQQIINAFAKYPNTLAFSAGNEVNHIVPTGQPEVNAPCQKKFMADMRKYIAECSSDGRDVKMRRIPVGVVVADTDRDLLAKYYNCRSDATNEYENAEFYGLNTYIHCDGSVTDSRYATGFNDLLGDLDSYKYSIPVLLTEFGCLSPSFPTLEGFEAQRNFLQVRWMFSPTFRAQLAGGFVFEYSTERANAESTSPFPFTSYGPQNYGVGYFAPVNCDEIDEPCAFNRMPNFDALAAEYAGVKLTEPPLAEFTPALDRRAPTQCPIQFRSLASFTWGADTVASLACTATAFTCPKAEEERSSGDSGARTESGGVASLSPATWLWCGGGGMAVVAILGWYY